MFNPNKDLTRDEKRKLETGDRLVKILEKEGLKALIELLENRLERTEWNKIGLRLINDYQRIGKIENIKAEYKNQYPTDADLDKE